MILVVRENKWLNRIARGLYRERAFLIRVCTITPVATFLALSLAFGHNPGPQGIGSAFTLIAALVGIYGTVLGSFVAMLGVGEMMDTLFLRVFALWPKGQKTPPMSAGEPRYWTDNEKRPPRA